MPKSPMRPMKWEAPEELALALVFEGRYTHAQIVDEMKKRGGANEASADKSAQKFAISTRTLVSWIAHPDFQTRLARLMNDFRLATRDVTFANKGRRIYALDGAAKIALEELEAHTHLIESRPTKGGTMTTESFNVAAMSEFRAALADIAAEYGDRRNVTEVTGSVMHSLVPDGALKELATALRDSLKGDPAAKLAMRARILELPPASGE